MGTRPVVSARLRVVLAMVVALSLSALPLPVGGVATPVAAATVGTPNRSDPTSRASSVKRALPTPRATTGAPTSLGRRQPPPVPMAPARIDLDPSAATSFVSPDGLLEVEAPAGAVSASDVAGAGGRLGLVIRQVLPASGGNAGGSGLYSFGTFVVQAVDARGALLETGLRQPLSFRLHPRGRAEAVDLAHVVAVLDPSLPSWFDRNPPAVATTAASGTRTRNPSSTSGPPAPGQGSPVHRRMALDAGSGTLSTSAPMSGPSAAVSFETDAPIATFGRPDPFEASLSGGALTADFPLDIPAGPGGLTPPLTLAYNSAGVSDQHNPAAAAGWVGEGWNLTLGSITWAEHNLATVNQQSTAPIWEDSWQMTDPYGSGVELIPPNVNVKTYVDDTPNPITPSPVRWHTAPETRDRVISFTNPTPGFNPSPPCFRAWKPNGIMLEYGCTLDSLQWYPQPSGSNTGLFYVSGWLLDLITDPQGNQVHVTYSRDMATGTGGRELPA